MKPLSPLRYPGGKYRALPQILPRVPDFKEYREPFVGGGSVFLEVINRHPYKSYWANDLNRDLYHFWQVVQACPMTFTDSLTAQKNYWTSGRDLFEHFKPRPPAHWTHFDIALRYFILNRISFSGAVDCSGYSEDSFRNRFTHSAIARIELASALLRTAHLSNLDYEDLVFAPGDDVFIFLDPPYLSATKSKLYGVRGDLHTDFDFERLSRSLKECKHRWLMTMDDCPQVRDLFSWANLSEWSLQYGMGNGSGKAPKGSELFISNY